MKLSSLYSAIVLALLFLICCHQKDRNIGKEEVESGKLRNIEVSMNRSVKDSIFTYNVKLNSVNNYSLTIETTLINDSLFLVKDYYSGGNKVVINQSLIFKYKDSVICKKTFLVSDEEVVEKVIGNKKVILPKYVLTNFLYKELKDETIYILYSFGLSNGSNEISSYYSNKGIFIGSTNCSRIKCDTIGNLFEIESKYNIYDSTKLKQVYIFPPQVAGQDNW